MSCSAWLDKKHTIVLAQLCEKVQEKLFALLLATGSTFVRTDTQIINTHNVRLMKKCLDIRQTSSSHLQFVNIKQTELHRQRLSATRSTEPGFAKTAQLRIVIVGREKQCQHWLFSSRIRSGKLFLRLVVILDFLHLLLQSQYFYLTR